MIVSVDVQHCSFDAGCAFESETESGLYEFGSADCYWIVNACDQICVGNGCGSLLLGDVRFLACAIPRVLLCCLLSFSGCFACCLGLRLGFVEISRNCAWIGIQKKPNA